MAAGRISARLKTPAVTDQTTTIRTSTVAYTTPADSSHPTARAMDTPFCSVVFVNLFRFCLAAEQSRRDHCPSACRCRDRTALCGGCMALHCPALLCVPLEFECASISFRVLVLVMSQRRTSKRIAGGRLRGATGGEVGPGASGRVAAAAAATHSPHSHTQRREGGIELGSHSSRVNSQVADTRGRR